MITKKQRNFHLSKICSHLVLLYRYFFTTTRRSGSSGTEDHLSVSTFFLSLPNVICSLFLTIREEQVHFLLRFAAFFPVLPPLFFSFLFPLVDVDAVPKMCLQEGANDDDDGRR